MLCVCLSKGAGADRESRSTKAAARGTQDKAVRRDPNGAPPRADGESPEHSTVGSMSLRDEACSRRVPSRSNVRSKQGTPRNPDNAIPLSLRTHTTSRCLPPLSRRAHSNTDHDVGLSNPSNNRWESPTAVSMPDFGTWRSPAPLIRRCLPRTVRAPDRIAHLPHPHHPYRARPLPTLALCSGYSWCPFPSSAEWQPVARRF